MSENGKIKFKYIFPDNYNPVYCSGALGGITPSGEIVANFFLERMPIPKSITNSLDESGNLGKIAATEPKDLNETFIRYISTGIILSEENARSIYDWLGEQIEKLDRIKDHNNTEIRGE